MISVSVVSHGQGKVVESLLRDLDGLSEVSRIVLTHNLHSEPEILVPSSFADRAIRIRNRLPKGFGANHNQAFNLCDTEYFLVINPDVRVNRGNPFPPLLDGIRKTNAAIAVPVVRSSSGQVEDSIRTFPTPFRLVLKLIGLHDGRISSPICEPKTVDWAAGMFMLFRAEAYKELGGFDEKFFLYYEDVDICTRCHKLCLPVLACPGAEVTHDAQRASRRRLRYLRWHLGSLIRYQLKHLWTR